MLRRAKSEVMVRASSARVPSIPASTLKSSPSLSPAWLRSFELPTLKEELSDDDFDFQDASEAWAETASGPSAFVSAAGGWSTARSNAVDAPPVTPATLDTPVTPAVPEVAQPEDSVAQARPSTPPATTLDNPTISSSPYAMTPRVRVHLTPAVRSSGDGVECQLAIAPVMLFGSKTEAPPRSPAPLGAMLTFLSPFAAVSLAGRSCNVPSPLTGLPALGAPSPYAPGSGLDPADPFLVDALLTNTANASCAVGVTRAELHASSSPADKPAAEVSVDKRWSAADTGAAGSVHDFDKSLKSLAKDQGARKAEKQKAEKRNKGLGGLFKRIPSFFSGSNPSSTILAEEVAQSASSQSVMVAQVELQPAPPADVLGTVGTALSPRDAWGGSLVYSEPKLRQTHSLEAAFAMHTDAIPELERPVSTLPAVPRLNLHHDVALPSFADPTLEVTAVGYEESCDKEVSSSVGDIASLELPVTSRTVDSQAIKSSVVAAVSSLADARLTGGLVPSEPETADASSPDEAPAVSALLLEPEAPAGSALPTDEAEAPGTSILADPALTVEPEAPAISTLLLEPEAPAGSALPTDEAEAPGTGILADPALAVEPKAPAANSAAEYLPMPVELAVVDSAVSTSAEEAALKSALPLQFENPAVITPEEVSPVQSTSSLEPKASADGILQEAPADDIEAEAPAAGTTEEAPAADGTPEEAPAEATPEEAPAADGTPEEASADDLPEEAPAEATPEEAPAAAGTTEEAPAADGTPEEAPAEDTLPSEPEVLVKSSPAPEAPSHSSAAEAEAPSLQDPSPIAPLPGQADEPILGGDAEAREAEGAPDDTVKEGDQRFSLPVREDNIHEVDDLVAEERSVVNPVLPVLDENEPLDEQALKSTPVGVEVGVEGAPRDSTLEMVDELGLTGDVGALAEAVVGSGQDPSEASQQEPAEEKPESAATSNTSQETAAHKKRKAEKEVFPEDEGRWAPDAPAVRLLNHPLVFTSSEDLSSDASPDVPLVTPMLTSTSTCLTLLNSAFIVTVGSEISSAAVADKFSSLTFKPHVLESAVAHAPTSGDQGQGEGPVPQPTMNSPRPTDEPELPDHTLPSADKGGLTLLASAIETAVAGATATDASPADVTADQSAALTDAGVTDATATQGADAASQQPTPPVARPSLGRVSKMPLETTSRKSGMQSLTTISQKAIASVDVSAVAVVAEVPAAAAKPRSKGFFCSCFAPQVKS